MFGMLEKLQGGPDGWSRVREREREGGAGVREVMVSLVELWSRR